MANLKVQKARHLQNYVVQILHNEFEIDTEKQTFKILQTNSSIEVLEDLNRDGRVYKKVTGKRQQNIIKSILKFDSKLLNSEPIDDCIQDCIDTQNW